jgi:hypothetical protein
MPFPEIFGPDEYDKDAKDMAYILRLDNRDYYVSAIINNELREFNPEVQDLILKTDESIQRDVWSSGV